MWNSLRATLARDDNLLEAERLPVVIGLNHVDAHIPSRHIIQLDKFFFVIG